MNIGHRCPLCRASHVSDRELMLMGGMIYEIDSGNVAPGASDSWIEAARLVMAVARAADARDVEALVETFSTLVRFDASGVVAGEVLEVGGRTVRIALSARLQAMSDLVAGAQMYLTLAGESSTKG